MLLESVWIKEWGEFALVNIQVPQSRWIFSMPAGGSLPQSTEKLSHFWMIHVLELEVVHRKLLRTQRVRQIL